MTCKNCETAKKAYLDIAKTLPREEAQSLAVVCRICNTAWHAIPENR